MSLSNAEVEERLAGSYRVLVADVPEYPPLSWSAYAATSGGLGRHWHRIVGVAASIVLVILATTLWATPSAGSRYHGAEVLRVRAPGVAQLQRSQACPCSSKL